MKSFKQYEAELQEFAFLRKAVAFVKNKIKSALSSLGFGKKVRIPLTRSQMTEEVDIKSRLGYYSEYVTAYNIALILKSLNARLTPSSMPDKLRAMYEQKKAELLKLDPPADEMARQESAGKAMAQQIVDDIKANVEDFPFLTFDVELTGDSGKGVTKADLVLTVTKDSKKQVVDKIMASLKAYKTSSINLSNSTYLSLIKTLFYDAGSSLPTKSDEFVKKFIRDFGSSDDIKRLLELQGIIGTKMQQGADKPAARKEAKASHGEVIEVISRIFAKYYKTHKKEINERMLTMLGFDGEDDFYAAIGAAGKQKVLSSRNSQELRDMIAQLSAGFDLTIERNGNTNNANILFKAPNGDTITKANITFADTGGPKPLGKTNTFVDFKRFLKK
jgi:hypothetical protein